jgi:hypothetical protein
MRVLRRLHLPASSLCNTPQQQHAIAAYPIAGAAAAAGGAREGRVGGFERPLELA